MQQQSSQNDLIRVAVKFPTYSSPLASRRPDCLFIAPRDEFPKLFASARIAVLGVEGAVSVFVVVRQQAVGP